MDGDVLRMREGKERHLTSPVDVCREFNKTCSSSSDRTDESSANCYQVRNAQEKIHVRIIHT